MVDFPHLAEDKVVQALVLAETDLPVGCGVWREDTANRVLRVEVDVRIAFAEVAEPAAAHGQPGAVERFLVAEDVDPGVTVDRHRNCSPHALVTEGRPFPITEEHPGARIVAPLRRLGQYEG